MKSKPLIAGVVIVSVLVVAFVAAHLIPELMQILKKFHGGG
jgi:hypothetical protein